MKWRLLKRVKTLIHAYAVTAKTSKQSVSGEIVAQLNEVIFRTSQGEAKSGLV